MIEREFHQGDTKKRSLELAKERPTNLVRQTDSCTSARWSLIQMFPHVTILSNSVVRSHQMDPASHIKGMGDMV